MKNRPIQNGNAVMDYIEGESLDRLLREYGPQPQGLVLDWAKQICDVLAYLHTTHSLDNPR